MSGSSPDRALAIRPARADDRDAILAFSRETWSWGDYLEHVWDEWLASSEGRLLVGEIDGRPIAVGRARLVASGEGWLEGLRVDPSARRSGVGMAMTTATLGVARDLGAEVVRFATRADAFPVHLIAERLGFVKAASYSILTAPALDDGEQPAVPLGVEDEDWAWSLLSTASPALTWRHWHCRTLNQDELLERIGTEEAFAPAADAGASGEAVAFAVENPEESQLVVDLVAGRDPASLRALGLSLRRLAARRGLESVEARVLDDAALIAALDEAGYSALGEGHVPYWIFEWRDAR